MLMRHLTFAERLLTGVIVAENIIAPNVPNAITIVVMMMLGGVILGAVKKAVTGNKGADVSSGPAFSG